MAARRIALPIGLPAEPQCRGGDVDRRGWCRPSIESRSLRCSPKDSWRAPAGAARRGELNAPPIARTVDVAMVRIVILAGALLAAAAAPAHAMGHSGGHSGGHHGGGSFHGHHGGFHHHGFHSFVGVGVFDPWYPYYYPYPYDYPYVYPPPVVVEPPPPAVAQQPIQREVVYPTGKYVLHGDGINYPWQWVWIPAAPPPPPPPTP